MKPFRILLCILSTFAVLAAVCVLFAGKSEVVRVPTLASVLGLPQHVADTLIVELPPMDTLPLLADTVSAQPEQLAETDTLPVKPRVVELPEPMPQTVLALHAFYRALEQSDRRTIRIVHFGDSQIEEDRMSMIIRRRLQDRFGGGGIGLLPMVQTIPTYTAMQSIEQDGKEQPYTFVRRYLSYGPQSMRLRDSNLYGPMAQVAELTQTVDVRVELLRDRVPTYDYSCIRVLYTDSVVASVVPDSLMAETRVSEQPSTDTLHPAPVLQQAMISLTESQRRSLIRLSGKGYVYGISLETPTGVQVDNIPMRGAAGTHFIMTSQQQLAAYFRLTNTALVIMQFGGNALPGIRSQAAVTRYVEAMRQQIHHVMAAAPGASLLFIGPSDMITTIEGEQQTYPLLPPLDSQLAAMVSEEGGAYYSLFRLMGGAGSMISWHDKGLAGDDLVHFTRAGAKKVGEMLAKQILEDFDSLSPSLPSREGVAEVDTLNHTKQSPSLEGRVGERL